MDFLVDKGNSATLDSSPITLGEMSAELRESALVSPSSVDKDSAWADQSGSGAKKGDERPS